MQYAWRIPKRIKLRHALSFHPLLLIYLANLHVEERKGDHKDNRTGELLKKIKERAIEGKMEWDW